MSMSFFYIREKALLHELWLLLSFFAAGSHYVAQADLKLLDSSNPAVQLPE
jgi:hypothetical protein